MAYFQRRQGARGLSWRVQVRRHGQPALTKTFKRKADAERWARQVEGEMDLGRSLPTTESRRRTLAELIDRFLEAHYLDGTVYHLGQRSKLEWWSEEIGAHPLVDIRPKMIAEVRAQLINTAPKGRPVSASTRNRYVAALSVVLSYGVRELEWLPANPAMSVKREKEPRGRVRFLSDDERERLLDAARDSFDPRLYLMVLLAVSTGMRQGEIIGLRWPHVDLAAGVARLEQTKNGERRTARGAARGPRAR